MGQTSEAPATRVEELAAREGERVRVRGWLSKRRSSGKLHFLQVRDSAT
jgi:asparaginyl-tRNA synthetase